MRTSETHSAAAAGLRAIQPQQQAQPQSGHARVLRFISTHLMARPPKKGQANTISWNTLECTLVIPSWISSLLWYLHLFWEDERRSK